MSLFKVSDQSTPPIDQTEVRIPSLNGLSYSPGQQIQIFVDPSRVEHIIGKDSYLEFECKISLNDETSGSLVKLQLDSQTGGNCLLRNVRLFSGNKKNLLEEIVAYNSYVAIKYDYETSPGLTGKRYTEGVTSANVANRGTNGGTKSQQCDTVTNPYFKKSAASASDFANTDFLTCKITLPIHLGLFQMESVLPIALMEGIFLECDLESEKNIFRMLDSVSYGRRPLLNPKISSIYNSSDGAIQTTWSDGDPATALYLHFDNSQYDIAHCPVAVGETIALFDVDTGTRLNASLNAVVSQITTEEVSNSTTIKLVFAEVTNSTGADVDFSASNIALYDYSVEGTDTFAASYEISKVNLVLKKISPSNEFVQDLMTSMKAGGVINIDYHTVTNYQRSVLASDRVVNLRIDVNNSRCKSIICQPTDATRYATNLQISASDTYPLIEDWTNADDAFMNSDRTGFVGCQDNATDYSWVINQKLVPSRPIPVSNMSRKSNPSVSAQHLVEVEKALYAAGITPLSYKSHIENFIICRALGLEENAVQDLAGKGIVLQLNYNETDAPELNKLFNNYLFHIRSLRIRDGAVEVIH